MSCVTLKREALPISALVGIEDKDKEGRTSSIHSVLYSLDRMRRGIQRESDQFFNSIASIHIYLEYMVGILGGDKKPDLLIEISYLATNMINND